MGDIQTQLPVAYTTDGTNTVQVFGTGTVAALWVHPDGTGTIVSNAGSGTFTVSVSNSPTVTANAGSGTFTVTGTVTTVASSGTFTVVLSGGTNTVVSNAGSGTFTVTTLANEAAATTGTITTNTSSIIAPVSGYTKVLVTLHGTYAGVTFGFSLSDDGGTTYYPIEAMTTDFQSIGTSFTPATNATVAYYVQIGGADHLQVLASAYTSGTANVRITPVNDPSGPYVYVTNTIAVSPTGTQTVVISNTPTVISNAGSGTFTTSISGTPTVVANAGSGTFTVGGTVTVNAGSGTFTTSISNTPTVVANAGSGTFTTSISNTPTVVANAGSGTFTVTGTVSTTPGEDTTGIVHQYGTVASVAANSTGTITYTVTAGKTLYLKTVQSSSSGGPCKVQVCVGSTATVIATGFYTSATLERQLFFTQPYAVAAGVVVFLLTQNNANQSQDIYGFINGHEQ
jgi:hypothetical protein